MNRFAIALASIGCSDPGAYIRIYGPIEGSTLATTEPVEVYGAFVGRGAEPVVTVTAAPCAAEASCDLEVSVDRGAFTASWTPGVAGPAWVWACVVNDAESDADIVELVVDDP